MRFSTLIDVIESGVAADPDAPAVIHGDVACSFQELYQQSGRVAAGLVDGGVQPGDRVGLLAENSAQYVAGFFGILRAGACVVAMNPANRGRKLRQFLDDGRAAALVMRNRDGVRHLPALCDGNPHLKLIISDALPEGLLGMEMPAWAVIGDLDDAPVDHRPAPEDLAAIFYTSGSTGKSRGVALTHRNLSANTGQILEFLDLKKADRGLVVLPFTYSYGNSLLLTHLGAGATLVLENRFAFPQCVIDTMAREQVNWMAGVPSTYAVLASRTSFLTPGFMGEELPHLHTLTQAGGAMSPDLTRRILGVLPAGVRLFVMYGQTEAAARLSYVPWEALPAKLGSIGRAIPEVELTVRRPDGTECDVEETGEIVATGPNIMSGYWEAEQETRLVLDRQGLHTGDLARKDAEGFIFIVDRIKNMIKAGANRVSCLEVEGILCEHPAVAEACVYAVADRMLGEAIEAGVVLVPDSVCVAKDLQAHCRANLALYKIPRRIRILDSMPRTPAGKTDRVHLAEQAAGMLPAD